MKPSDVLDNNFYVGQKEDTPIINLTAAEKRVFSLFDNIRISDWEDWTWQIGHRYKTEESLSQVMSLTQEEKDGIACTGERLSMAIPPYFASLIDAEDPACPIRRQCVPLKSERERSFGEMSDPCGEEHHSPLPGLVHRYPDRVLLLVNERCAMYCRYCTRSRMVGDGTRTLSPATYSAAFDYIRDHCEVRDVLISGGDPLLLNDNLLEFIISHIKMIPHVEFVRIGTRIPVTLPQRITLNLVRLLQKYNPIWMSLHFSHPKELTPRVQHACNLLSDHGIPLGSQTVLLKGINDNIETMRDLMQGLLKNRIRPYYIYQCDPIVGSSHFRTPVRMGISLIRQLQGFTSGYAVPTFVIDAPGGGGKIPINPNYIVSHQDGQYILKNYEGKEFVYYDSE